MSTSLSEFQTPKIAEILDLHMAYGLIECSVRGGAEEAYMTPDGIGYLIRTIGPDDSVWKGMIDALEEMLSLHKAVGRALRTNRGVFFVSDVDFSAGAVVEQASQRLIPQYLESILDSLRANTFSNVEFSERNAHSRFRERYTVALPIEPSIGKYYRDMYGAPAERHPFRKINALDYALAWIGFHFYAPYLKLSVGQDIYIHIYPVKPLQKMNLIEALSIKDLKSPLGKLGSQRRNSSLDRRVAFLKYLTNLESVGALETSLRKELSIRSFTLEKVKRSQAVRSYMKIDLSKLMNFIWRLKAWDYLRAVRFLNSLTDSDMEISVPFIESILNGDPDGMYTSLRNLRRSGRWIDSDLIRILLNWFREYHKTP